MATEGEVSTTWSILHVELNCSVSAQDRAARRGRVVMTFPPQFSRSSLGDTGAPKKKKPGQFQGGMGGHVRDEGGHFAPFILETFT